MNKKPSTQLSADEKKEVEALKARLAELESVSNAEELKDEQKVKETKRDKVLLDDYVPVVSLIPYRLNLSTKEGGQGDVKKFTRFGEVKNILYKDLVDIIEVNRKFMEAGFFYILDPVVIRQHGLDEVYSKILTKEKIEEILNSLNTEYCIDLFNTANEEQQKIIVQLLIEKVKNDPTSINLYTVDRISRLSKVEITLKAEEEKALEKELVEQNQ